MNRGICENADRCKVSVKKCNHKNRHRQNACCSTFCVIPGGIPGSLCVSDKRITTGIPIERHRQWLSQLREHHKDKKRWARRLTAECVRDGKTIAAYARQIRAAERKKLSGF